MTSINNFETRVYSEELFPVSEGEYDEVMSLMAAEDEAMSSYAEWSEQVEVENFYIGSDGRTYLKPEPKSNGRYEGIEI